MRLLLCSLTTPYPLILTHLPGSQLTCPTMASTPKCDLAIVHFNDAYHISEVAKEPIGGAARYTRIFINYVPTLCVAGSWEHSKNCERRRIFCSLLVVISSIPLCVRVLNFSASHHAPVHDDACKYRNSAHRRSRTTSHSNTQAHTSCDVHTFSFSHSLSPILLLHAHPSRLLLTLHINTRE